jgi:hypothetical protein
MKKATRKPWGGKRPGAGRPASGQDPVTAIRLSKEMRARVNAWAAQQPDEPGRSEAIRRLVDLGLTIRETAKQPSPASAARAKELAAKAIERISDPAVPHDERVQRRRRLTKGPVELRDDRIDQPKAKGK